MVTKLSDTVVETETERQFKYLPNASSGLSYVISAGKLMERTGLVEFPQTTLTLTDNTTNYVVIDFATNPATIKAVTTVNGTSELLHAVVTASGVVSSSTDYRWKWFAGRDTFGSFNEIDEFLDANAWSYYPMRETSFPYADANSNGPTLGENTANTTIAGMIGLTRGTPRHGGVWILETSKTSGTLLASSGGLSASGWTVGGLGCAFYLPSQPTGQEAYFIWQRYTDTSLDNIYIGVDTAGRLKCRTQFGSEFVQTISTSAVTLGVPHTCMAMQAADGNGLRLYLDGVDVTGTQTRSAGLGVNDWVDAAATADSSNTTATNLRIGTTDGSQGQRCTVSVPAFFNTALTSTQALEYHNAFNLTGQPSDTWEFLLDEFMQGNGDEGVAFLITGISTAEVRSLHMGYGTTDLQSSYTGTLFYDDKTAMNTEYGSVGADFSLASGSPPQFRELAVTMNTEFGPSSTNTSGTFLAMFTPKNAASASNNQYVCRLGAADSLFTDASYGGFNVYCLGNDSGDVSIFLVLHTNTTGSIYRVGSVGEYPINNQYRLVLTQNGTALACYVNGVSKTLTATSTKNSTDITTEWVGDMIDDYFGANWTMYIGSDGTSANDFEGIVHFIGFTDTADVWGTTEVEQLENAIAGTGEYI